MSPALVVLDILVTAFGGLFEQGFAKLKRVIKG
jgi:hypothetical protein